MRKQIIYFAFCLMLFIFSGCEQEGDSVKEYLGSQAKLLSKKEYPELYDSVCSLMETKEKLESVINSGSGSSKSLIQVNGDFYNLVEYEDVHSWEEFEACLKDIYADEYVEDKLVPYCTEGFPPLFTDYEGGLYRRMADAPMDGLSQDNMCIYQVKEGEWALACELAHSDSDETDQKYEIWYFSKNTDKLYGYELVSMAVER